MAGAPNLDGLVTVFWILFAFALVGVIALIYGIVWLFMNISVSITI